MGGPKIQPSQNLANQQVGVSQEELALAREDRARRDQLIQPAVDVYKSQIDLQNPAIDFLKRLTSGDSSAVTTAAAPILSQITRQFQGAEESVYSNAPRGAARDFALSQIPVQQADSTAQALSAPITGAYSTLLNLGQSATDKLANVASGFGSFSLQEVGAGLRAQEGAAGTLNNVMQAQAARKAATMGFLGNLAQAGGIAAGGALSHR